MDFYISATGQYTQRYTPFTIVEAFYMFRDRDHCSNSMRASPIRSWSTALPKPAASMSWPLLYYGARQMTTSKKPLNTAADIAGLKMRAANEPLPIAAFTTLGATPTPIAYNETYLALQAGHCRWTGEPARFHQHHEVL